MLSCSHVMCRVDDLRALVRDYEDLGFTVEWGAAPERAHNAFVHFSEGPFLEFYDTPSSARWFRVPFALAFGAAAGERLVRWAGPGQGCRDVAVASEDTSLAATRAALRSRGVPTSRVIKGKRTRPDGVLVRYEFLATRPAGMPFVVSAYDPPQRPGHVEHANGARGIHRVRLGVADTDRGVLDALVPDDPHLEIVAGPVTGVLGVELDGLTDELDAAKLHGAALTRAARTTEEGLS